ncbi:nitroreductase family deazaflavin-dependent oxidoreductase [Pseudonocardia petroleophila]|uniref:Nitroreductase family deazaflavin-dependent oxidoreductase n=1 Tax=Pseudonocardia petroleophila TaxID=37331 RepID=A0A7G7MEH2_9PSEU|nr:nitroreductase/quinone reductase family protein [Pseudonocardia petroleophila]QNG51183.1 nitroreductase family deazaflavin-dependent oxidoreductase [Pseudonocardia petroleophila]
MTERTDRRAVRPPAGLKEMNEELMEQQRAGALPFDLPVLTVPGRRSGVPRHTPLTVLDRDGVRFVVGGFPAADWIRNLRAAGGLASLRTGGVDEAVRLVELDVADAAAVLREWPVVTPQGVQMMRDAGVVDDVTPDALAEAAGTCPVYRIERVV